MMEGWTDLFHGTIPATAEGSTVVQLEQTCI